jgi:hypothetical protein
MEILCANEVKWDESVVSAIGGGALAVGRRRDF